MSWRFNHGRTFFMTKQGGQEVVYDFLSSLLFAYIIKKRKILFKRINVVNYRNVMNIYNRRNILKGGKRCKIKD